MASLVKIHIVKWLLDGKRVPANTSGAKKITRKSKKWYGQGIPGQKGRVPLAVNKDVALQKLAKLCRAGELKSVGLPDDTGTRKVKDLAEHIADFRGWLTAADNTADYVRIASNRVTETCAGCGFTSLDSLDGLAAADWLATQRKVAATRGTITGTMSITTSNLYMDALNQFGRWLVAEGRLDSNPFARLIRGNRDTDKRRARRAMKHEEFKKLLNAARKSKKIVYRLSGEDRYWLYRTAYYTGFRAAALGSLTRESFDFAATPPTVTLATMKNKSRKLKVNVLPPAFAKQLRKYVEQFAPNETIWGRGVSMDHGADMVRADLEAADIAFEIPGPDGLLRFDFHAIRHTAATELTRYDLRTAQQILGHSKPSITARYAHRDLNDEADAVGQMRG